MIKNYNNNFGGFSKSYVTLTVNNREQTISLENIIKIRFVKRQKYHINYLLFLLFIGLFFLLKNNNFSYFVQIIISSIMTLFLVASYFFRTFQYRFIVIKRFYLADIIVSKKMSTDAENLAYQINKTLKVSL